MQRSVQKGHTKFDVHNDIMFAIFQRCHISHIQRTQQQCGVGGKRSGQGSMPSRSIKTSKLRYVIPSSIEQPRKQNTAKTATDRPDQGGRNEPGSNRHTKTWEIRLSVCGQGFPLALRGRKKTHTHLCKDERPDLYQKKMAWFSDALFLLPTWPF